MRSMYYRDVTRQNLQEFSLCVCVCVCVCVLQFISILLLQITMKVAYKIYKMYL
jgi:hypothetical protein